MGSGAFSLTPPLPPYWLLVRGHFSWGFKILMSLGNSRPREFSAFWALNFVSLLLASFASAVCLSMSSAQYASVALSSSV